jgi:hypothetical protein
MKNGLLKFFAGGDKPANRETIAKSTEMLAESLGSIFTDDKLDDAKKREGFANSLKQFEDHLAENLTAEGSPPGKQEEHPMLKTIAKLLGLKEDASETDIEKAYEKRERERDRQLAELQFTPEEKAFYETLKADADEEDEDVREGDEGGKPADDKSRFRRASKEMRAELMAKAKVDDKMSEPLRKALADNDELKKRVEKMEEDNKRADIRKRVLDAGLAEDDVDDYYKQFKSDPEVAERQLKRAAAGWVAAKKAGAFREIGGTGAGMGNTTPMDELNAKAAEYRKANPTLSPHQAFAKVYEDPANAEIVKREREAARAPVLFPPGTMQ